ncbi:MAG: FAD-dependent oxidoreductase [Pirellulales bacterium]
MSRERTESVVVIGGGVVGTACAYYLAQEGWRVTLIERRGYGSGCSHANCGYVSPSHVLPLAEPGAIQKTLKAMLHPSSPFSIRPRFDPTLWSWLLHFARRCNTADMLQSAQAIHALLESSRQLYPQLIEQHHLACEWQTIGLLFVFESLKGFDKYSHTNDLLADKFDVPAQPLRGSQLTDFEPALKPGLAGAWYYPNDAHLRPDRLLSSWRKVLERIGVVIKEQCELESFVAEGGRVRAVKTSAGELAADQFVLATGALTPRFAQQLGCRIPIQPGKGYSITMPRPDRCPKYPMIFSERKVAITPMNSGYRIGSTMEFAGYDESISAQRLQLLTDAARDYLFDPYVEPFEERWYGWRPMTYDSVPIIDYSPRLPNVLIAAGHNMLGLSMATGTGRLVSEMLSGHRPHIDRQPYRVGRFG